MQKAIHLAFILTINILFFTKVSAQNQLADKRVSENLNKLNFKYDVKEDGTFQFTVPVGNRSQMIFIHSNTSSYDNLEIREVYSVIYQSASKPEDFVLTKLLIDNGQKKLGAWELIFDNNLYFLVFTAKVSPTLDAANLKSVIDIVATSSDSLEQILFTTDEW